MSMYTLLGSPGAGGGALELSKSPAAAKSPAATKSPVAAKSPAAARSPAARSPPVACVHRSCVRGSTGEGHS